MKKTEYIYICDICEDTMKSSSFDFPDGWVVIKVEKRLTDRAFNEKHICDECCLEIKDRHSSI